MDCSEAEKESSYSVIEISAHETSVIENSLSSGPSLLPSECFLSCFLVRATDCRRPDDPACVAERLKLHVPKNR